MNDAKRRFRLHDGKSGAAITVRVTPRASRDELSEVLDDGTLKVRLTAPAGDQDLDRALIVFLSGLFGVKPAQLEIVAGTGGVDKLVTITGLDASQVQTKILYKINQG
jgi:uncharacterized protein YggU (UPF0235/DUF167 family)